MPGTRRRRARKSGASVRGKLLALLLAVVWLAFLTILGAHSVSATPLRFAVAADSGTPTDTPTDTLPTNTPTTAAPPTNTPHTHQTPTPTISASPTGSTTVTATTAPTATTDTSSSGGGNPNDPGSGSSQATKLALAQPTYAGGVDPSQTGISVASFGSNGLLFASAISCLVGLLGIIVAVIAVQILRRDGYGPFLRALLLGKRANRPASPKVAASGAGGARRAAWSAGDRDGYSGEDESVSGFGRAAPPSGAGRRSPPPGASSPRQRSSRPDW